MSDLFTANELRDGEVFLPVGETLEHKEGFAAVYRTVTGGRAASYEPCSDGTWCRGLR